MDVSQQIVCLMNGPPAYLKSLSFFLYAPLCSKLSLGFYVKKDKDKHVLPWNYAWEIPPYIIFEILMNKILWRFYCIFVWLYHLTNTLNKVPNVNKTWVSEWHLSVPFTGTRHAPWCACGALASLHRRGYSVWGCLNNFITYLYCLVTVWS